MAEREIRQVGNMRPDEIHSTEDRCFDNGGRPVPSLARQWAMQGIQYELTDPVATETYTSEELTTMGLKGLTLIIPPVATE